MSKSKVIRTLAILFIVVANISCDQVSKKIVRTHISHGELIEVLDDNFILTKVENTGAFLSLGSALPEIARNIILLVFPSLVLIVILIVTLTSRKFSNLAIVGLSFITGGGIGNIYDRIIYGSVTDFLHIDLGFFQTGIFNLADVSIMIGVGLMLLEYFLKRKVKEADIKQSRPL